MKCNCLVEINSIQLNSKNNGHFGVVPRLKSRNSFIKYDEHITTTAKSARMVLWRERHEPLDASVHRNISADEHLPDGEENL